MFTKGARSQEEKNRQLILLTLCKYIIQKLPESLDQKCMQCPVIPEFA